MFRLCATQTIQQAAMPTPNKSRIRSADDHELIHQLSRYDDDTYINVFEMAALTGFSPHSIRQRKIKALPKPDTRVKALRWRLGDVREFIRNGRALQKTTTLISSPVAQRRISN